MDFHSWLPCRLVPFDRSAPGTPVGPNPSQCTDAGWSPDGRTLFYLVRSYGMRTWNQGVLWAANLETGQRRPLLPDSQIVHYSISSDGRRIVFVPVDEQGRTSLWLASVDGLTPPRQVNAKRVSMAFFGLPGELLFETWAKDDMYIYRVKEDGRELQKVVTTPLFLLSASPDGRWMAVGDPAAWGALFVYPVGGGSPLRLCDRCAPPWGTDPIPVYFGWTPDSKFLYWKFGNSTFAIPLKRGQVLPPIPAGGVQTRDAAAALPGARLISEQERPYPGPDPSVYAFMRVTTQRNIYRVPIQ